MAPIKAMPNTLLDDQESQHKDGLRKTIRIMKGVGQSFGARKGEDAIDVEKLLINVVSFVNRMKYEF